jgi:hypothetical protein
MSFRRNTNKTVSFDKDYENQQPLIVEEESKLINASFEASIN